MRLGRASCAHMPRPVVFQSMVSSSTGGELGFVLVTAQADCQANLVAVGDSLRKCGLAEQGRLHEQILFEGGWR